MRHREAGACEVLVSSPKRIAHIEERKDDDALFALLSRIHDADIILVEGFKLQRTQSWKSIVPKTANSP